MVSMHKIAVPFISKLHSSNRVIKGRNVVTVPTDITTNHYKIPRKSVMHTGKFNGALVSPALYKYKPSTSKLNAALQELARTTCTFKKLPTYKTRDFEWSAKKQTTGGSPNLGRIGSLTKVRHFRITKTNDKHQTRKSYDPNLLLNPVLKVRPNRGGRIVGTTQSKYPLWPDLGKNKNKPLSIKKPDPQQQVSNN